MMPAFALRLSVSGLEACKMKVNRLTSMETDQAKRSPSFDKVVCILLLLLSLLLLYYHYRVFICILFINMYIYIYINDMCSLCIMSK